MRSKARADASSTQPAQRSALRCLAQGVLMIFFSPGLYLFWAAVLGPLLREALALSLVHGILFLPGFYGFSIGGLQLIALILGRIGELSPAGKRLLQNSSLALMLVIAALLVQNGLQA